MGLKNYTAGKLTEEQKKIKAFLDMAQKSNDYIVRSADNNENFYILDKKTGFIFIVRTFQEQYEMDFLTKDAVRLITDLAKVMESMI